MALVYSFSLLYCISLCNYVLEKAGEPEIKLPTSAGSSIKEESSRKKIYFCSIDYAKTLSCIDHNKL